MSDLKASLVELKWGTGPQSPPMTWANVGTRRAKIARDLGFEVMTRDSNDVDAAPIWIPRKLNTLMILVEMVLFDGCARQAAVEFDREIRVLRVFDARPELLQSLDAAQRLGGEEAVREIVIALDTGEPT